MNQSARPHRRKRSSLSGLLYAAVAALSLLFTVTASRAGTHYVNAGSTSPVPPYSSWSTAATTIQDAVDVAVPGDEIVVTNGIYASGGRAVDGTMTNRVAVTKPLTVRSVNGPQFTAIQGRQLPGTTNGDGAIRCVYLTNGAALFGFTLTNGATRNAGNLFREQEGGGIYCESVSALVSNCVIVGNSAVYLASGVMFGTLQHCTIATNSPAQYVGVAYESVMNDCVLLGNSGGGSFGAALNNCTLSGNSSGGAFAGTLTNRILSGNTGGGVSYSTLYNCTLSNNSGGGAIQSTLYNCLLVGNSASAGGGAALCILNNCTVTRNWATDGGGVYGGTSSNGFLNNCIISFNSATNGDNYSGGGSFNYCCTTPLPPGGAGNISLDPLFVDLVGGNFRLQSNSPCINAGNNASAVGSTDLDGHPRIIGGTVDMGAYEFVPSPSMRIARASPNITLAWPLWASNFVAQESSTLPTNSGAWSNVAATASQTANENVVTVPSTNSAKFFRLFLP